MISGPFEEQLSGGRQVREKSYLVPILNWHVPQIVLPNVSATASPFRDNAVGIHLTGV